MDGQPPNDAGLEGGQAPSPLALPSAPVAEPQPVPESGGGKGGRPREDGLVPGSPEAVAADKAYDAERKRAERAAKKNGGQSPAALPSVLDAANPDAPKTAAPAAPVVLWKPGNLVCAFKTVIPGLEDWSRQSLVSKASKVPGMPREMLEVVEADAGWDPKAKDALVAAGAALTAKYLNRAGVSSEYEPEVNFISAAVSIGAGYLTLSAKLDKWAKQGIPGQSAKPPVEPKADAP